SRVSITRPSGPLASIARMVRKLSGDEVVALGDRARRPQARLAVALHADVFERDHELPGDVAQQENSFEFGQGDAPGLHVRFVHPRPRFALLFTGARMRSMGVAI